MSMIPLVASAADLDDKTIQYGEMHPNSRWYLNKRAQALGVGDRIPGRWGLTAAIAAGDLNKEQRDALAKKGISLKDGSFPIRQRTDLGKAVQAFGRAKNKAIAKKHIIKRAKALHSTDLLPAEWKPLTAAVGDTPSDVAGVWAQQVRDALTDQGIDPDEVEAGTDGFAADHAEYADDLETYVAELVTAHAPDVDEFEDDGSVSGDVQVDTTEPEIVATPSMIPEPVQVAQPIDYDVLAAAVVAAMKKKDEPIVAPDTTDTAADPDADAGPVDQSLGLDTDPTGTEESAPIPVAAATPDDVPVDPAAMPATKEALAARFGKATTKKPKPAKAPAAAPVVPVVSSARDMRKAILAKRMTPKV